MGHSSRRLLVLTAIAGLIGTTVVVAGESEKSYLPSQTQAKPQVKAPEKALSADKAAKHKRHKVTKVKAKRHAHKRHRHHHRYAGGGFSPEDAILFLPRLVFGIFR
jgi:hypothetical protein